MKRKKIILPILLTALIASSCAEEAGNDSVGENPLPEAASSETLTESETPETAEISETSESSETSSTDETTGADSENVSDETEAAVTEKLSELSVAEVGIIGHIEEFDEVVPCKFTLGGEVELDPAILETAVKAYRQTDYYKDALEYMREKFAYDEEGGFVYRESGEPVDPDKTDFILQSILRRHKEVLTETSDHEIDFAPVPRWSYKIGDGYLTVLLTVLPGSLFIWSGSGTAYIPVYINGSGEAFVLDEACAQDYNIDGCFTVEYEDGSIHAVMDFGHNSIQFAKVYSFEGGVPKLEISGYGSIYADEDMPVLFAENSFHMNELFFRRENSSEYCLVKGVDADEELARAICSNETVLERVPDAWERYSNGGLSIYGGKYIAIYDGFAPTFSIDPQTGEVAPDKSVAEFLYDEFHGDLERFNIDLT